MDIFPLASLASFAHFSLLCCYVCPRFNEVADYVLRLLGQFAQDGRDVVQGTREITV